MIRYIVVDKETNNVLADVQSTEIPLNNEYVNYVAINNDVLIDFSRNTYKIDGNKLISTLKE